jgi:hypothetical protein
MSLRGLLIFAVATLAGFGLGFIVPGRQSTKSPGQPDASPYQPSAVGVASAPVDPLGTALEALSARDDLAAIARLGDAITPLNSEQLRALLDRVERSPDRDVRDGLTWLFSYLLKRDPSAAAEWIRPRLIAAAQDGPPGHGFDSSVRGRVILAWVKADQKAALAFAKEHPRTGLAGRLLSEAIKNWPEKDPAVRLAIIREFPAGKSRDDALRELLSDWADKDPKGALAQAEAITDDAERDHAFKSVLSSWGYRDPAAAFEKYLALGITDTRLLWELMNKGANKDPQMAIGWLASLRPGDFMRHAPIVAQAWAKRDPAAALNWALENNVPLTGQWTIWQSIHHNGLSRSTTSQYPSVSPLFAALSTKPDETMAWIRSLPPGQERERMLELAASSAKTPEQSIAIFKELSPQAAARTAASVVFSFNTDVDGARSWIESLPPGPERDAMLSGRAFGMGVRSSPISQLEIIAKIDDPTLKRDLFDQSMQSSADFESSDWLKQSLEWMETANVPEEWKQEYRKNYAKP